MQIIPHGKIQHHLGVWSHSQRARSPIIGISTESNRQILPSFYKEACNIPYVGSPFIFICNFMEKSPVEHKIKLPIKAVQMLRSSNEEFDTNLGCSCVILRILDRFA